MTEVIECPECRRKLSMRDEYLGQDVKCPSCGATFVASATLRPPPPTPPPPAARELPPRESSRRRDEERDDRRHDRDDDDRPRRDYDRDDYDRRRRDPYDDDRKRPDRGAAVLTLGILGLVFCWVPLAGWILGGIAWGMGNNDLSEMSRGRVSRLGESATQGGKVCGIIAVILATLFVFFYCMAFVNDRPGYY
jgi:hypothetical protein